MTADLSGYNILVVEDEALIMMMIEDQLADCGCEDISSTSTIGAALCALKGKRFDAAMIDLNLNGKLSYEIADELIHQGVPFFFCTGNSATDLKERYRQYPTLHKPFDDGQLAKMFTRILQ